MDESLLVLAQTVLDEEDPAVFSALEKSFARGLIASGARNLWASCEGGAC